MSTSIKLLRSTLGTGLLGLLLALTVPALAHGCIAPHGTPAERAAAIANGHAFTKHQSDFVNGKVINGLAFPGNSITDTLELADFIENIMMTIMPKALTADRLAYWDTATGTVVIFNPNADDCGTAFRPSKGMKYYNKLQ